jgi:DnaJ-domain-containing protein 1
MQVRHSRLWLLRRSSRLGDLAETIRSADKARMNEYHPDEVTHLGEKLRKLVNRRALELQRADQKLRK